MPFDGEVEQSTRRLATVRTITELLPIKGADRIEVAVVDGWHVITQKGIYKPGDTCIYLEIDSWVPTEVAPFLTKEGHSPKTYQGVQGERLKTMKMRGVVSQGLLLQIGGTATAPAVGDDLTETLGILKWERPVATQNGGGGSVSNALGHFPSDIRKTDQDRIQNVRHIVDDADAWETTLKMDGSSLTAYVDGKGVFNVCSRNLRLKEPAEPWLWRLSKRLGLEGRIRDFVQKRKGQFHLGRIAQRIGLTAPNQNNFWTTARKFKLEEAIRVINEETGTRVAFQGEMCGPGIQGNKEGFDDLEFFLFDIWDIKAGSYFLPDQRQIWAKYVGIQHCQVYPDLVTPASYDTVLNSAVGTSLHAKVREGLVFKSKTRAGVSFKAISNEFLLKHDE